MRKMFALLVFFPSLVWGQTQEAPDQWSQLRFLEGSWTGDVSGKAGIGKGEREYKFVMDETYMQCVNKAVFEPQEKNPEGEVHEDLGFFSYDQVRDILVYRQFHGEGFVNQYVLDSVSSDGKTIMFTTEVIENAPDGFRARLTVTKLGDDEFVEGFQLAPPGKDFGTCIENRWQREK
jgi:hypothetical protein